MGVFISDMLEILEIKCDNDITKKQQYGQDSQNESQPYCCPMCFTSEGEDNNTLKSTSLFTHPCATSNPSLIFYLSVASTLSTTFAGRGI